MGGQHWNYLKEMGVNMRNLIDSAQDSDTGEPFWMRNCILIICILLYMYIIYMYINYKNHLFAYLNCFHFPISVSTSEIFNLQFFISPQYSLVKFFLYYYIFYIIIELQEETFRNTIVYKMNVIGPNINFRWRQN